MSDLDQVPGLLSAIVASSDDAIISKDLQGFITSWNQGAERLFGYPAAEMIGQHITRMIPTERHSEADFVLSRIRAGLSVEHFETVRRRKDGTLVEISLTVSPVRNAEGIVIGASKIARDISERRRMERDAWRLVSIVESSQDAIVSKDLNGIVQTWNRGAEEIFGFSAEEIIGKSIETIIPDDRREEEGLVLSRIRAGESVSHFETIRRTRDGRLIDVSVAVSPIRGRNGAVVGASKIARDITQEKQLRREVAEASRAKDEFLAMLSHELRTPLNTVLGYTQMMKSGAISGADSEKALNVIARNADVLTRLVNDVLDTSRIVTGRLRLTLQACDVGVIAEEALAAVLPATTAKSITVTSNIGRDLIVHGDPDRLRQVFWNLLSNAVKFTNEGGELKVFSGIGVRTVGITVEDTGIGIAPESLPYVFRRFWQVDPTNTRPHGGLGLGLALARDFVELHGGHLEVRSEGLGRGARFDVLLPLAGVSIPAR